MAFDPELHGVCCCGNTDQSLDFVICLLVELLGHRKKILCYLVALILKLSIWIGIIAAPLDYPLPLRADQCRYTSLVTSHIVQQLFHCRPLLLLLGKDHIALELGPVQDAGIAIGGHLHIPLLPARTAITSGMTRSATWTQEPPLRT